MNATDSFLVPLTDAGQLNGLKAGALGARYRFWRDQDGQRHVFSVYPAGDAPDYPEAIAIAARRTPAGSIALWAGPPGEAAKRAAARYAAEEIHIHILGDAPPESLTRFLAPRGPVGGQLALPAPAGSRAVVPAARRHAA